jgi:hypothetical protein
MSSLIPARSSTFGALSTDKAAGKQLATIQLGAFIERAEHEARRNLTLARMADIGVATRHGLEEGEAIASDLLSRVENNPFALKALSGIAEDGVRGIRRELRRLSEGF